MSEGIKILSGDDELASDGHASFSLVKDVGLGQGIFGISARDGGGFTCVLLNKESWEMMKLKVDRFIQENQSES